MSCDSLNVSSFFVRKTTNPPVNMQLSGSLFLGNAFCFIGENQNYCIKKIIIDCRDFQANNPTKFWSLRFGLINRDGQVINGFKGNVVDPVSPPFDYSMVRPNEPIDIQLNRKNPEINFHNDSVIAGGISLRNFSWEAYNTNPLITGSKIEFNINIFYV